MTSKVAAHPSADCSCTVVPSGRTCGCGIIGTVIGQFWRVSTSGKPSNTRVASSLTFSLTPEVVVPRIL